MRQAFIDRQPMGRLGTAREIAKLALYLASDESYLHDGANPYRRRRLCAVNWTAHLRVRKSVEPGMRAGRREFRRYFVKSASGSRATRATAASAAIVSIRTVATPWS